MVIFNHLETDYYVHTNHAGTGDMIVCQIKLTLLVGANF